MSWTALIPLKGSGERKTRLARRLHGAQRAMLTECLLKHVTSVLDECPAISSIRLLSDIRPAGWDGPIERDEGEGLNAELRRVAGQWKSGRLLVLLPDLPLLSEEDISILVEEAEGGCAIAPDRHGLGTNAIALLDPAPFPFSFGGDSFARHLSASGGSAAVVRRTGLGFDMDFPEDLDEAIAMKAPGVAALPFRPKTFPRRLARPDEV